MITGMVSRTITGVTWVENVGCPTGYPITGVVYVESETGTYYRKSQTQPDPAFSAVEPLHERVWYYVGTPEGPAQKRALARRCKFDSSTGKMTVIN